MIYAQKNEAGEVVALFGAPQPDAMDDQGNVICPGVATVELNDDDTAVIAFRRREEVKP